MIRFAALALSVIVVPVAAAAEPTFSGAWADDKNKCRLAQDVQDAPYLITPRGYDQHETHCTFKTIMKKGRTYTTDASCSVEGDIQKLTFVMVVAADGKSMTLGDRSDPGIKLHRCR